VYFFHEHGLNVQFYKKFFLGFWLFWGFWLFLGLDLHHGEWLKEGWAAVAKVCPLLLPDEVLLVRESREEVLHVIRLKVPRGRGDATRGDPELEVRWKGRLVKDVELVEDVLGDADVRHFFCCVWGCKRKRVDGRSHFNFRPLGLRTRRRDQSARGSCSRSSRQDGHTASNRQYKGNRKRRT